MPRRRLSLPTTARRRVTIRWRRWPQRSQFAATHWQSCVRSRSSTPICPKATSARCSAPWRMIRKAICATTRKSFASAVGRSFYEQILPSESVTLGWSSWAVQWLSRMPALIPDHIHVASSHDASAHAAFAAQADAGLAALSHARARRELRSGGRMVVLTMALTDAGDFGYRAVLAAIYRGAHRTWSRQARSVRRN